MSLFQVTKKQVTENYELRTMTGDIVSFTPSYSQLLPDPFSDLNVTVNVLATGGNGTPDNPIPINGYSEANITRCGVNFFDKSTVTSGRIINGGGNDVSFSGWNVSDYIPVKEGVEFYLYGLTTHPNSNQDNFIFFNASKTKIGFANVKTWEYPLTIPSGVKFVKCTCSDTDLNTTQFSLTNNAPYEAYNGQTYTVNFGQTVYGGVLDVTRGKLTVTWTGIDLGSLNWYKVSAIPYPYFSAPIDEAYKYISGNTNSKCSNYTPASIGDSGDAQGYMILNINYVRLRDEDYYNVDENTFKTAISGVILAYELATPFDIDLTPEVISAIVGTNNVFADCGDVTVKCLI